MFELVTTPVAQLLGVVLGLLLLGTIGVYALQHKFGAGAAELKSRMVGWWLILGTFCSALVLGRTALLLFFAFVSYRALLEYFTMIHSRPVDRRAMFWCYLAVPAQFVLIAMTWRTMFYVFPFYMLLIVSVRMILTGDTKNFVGSTGAIFWGLILTVVSIGHLAYFVVAEPIGQATGVSMLLFVIVVTQCNDVAQYCWGKSFGRRKIVPTVSPGKTWAGFLGGVGTSVVLALLLGPWLTPLSVPLSVLAGVVIAIGGFFGDITISAIKRDCGRKDAGQLIPGHGGVLDRVDSLLFTGILMHHYIMYFCY